jgi:hypothetical protein
VVLVRGERIVEKISRLLGPNSIGNWLGSCEPGFAYQDQEE